jgi:Spy/CpxP family protein refolding chaperone
MKTGNKIILGISAIALISSTALATMKHTNCDRSTHLQTKQTKMLHHKERGIVPMIMKLNLSMEQRKQIGTILKELRKDIPHPTDAFSKTHFDKERFIQTAKERHTKRIEKKALLIEKIYPLLNSEQKKDLKTMLDMDKIKRKHKRF